MEESRVAVIGAGIVGLSVAYHLAHSGARVSVIDRAFEGDKASFGNAGAIAVTEVVPASAVGVSWRVLTWMLDPLGPLSVRPAHALRLIPWLARFASVSAPEESDRISRALAALNARAHDDLIPLLHDIGLSSELHRKGALTLYETERGYERDATEWRCKRSRGIYTEDLSGDQAREMEPALGSLVRRAIFTPQWSYVSDPRRIVDGLRMWLAQRGVAMIQAEANRIDPGLPPLESKVQLQTGREIAADRVVIAAGAWSGILAKRLGDRVLLESERGYNTTLPRPGVHLERQLIFAERRFVATPLTCGLRIGGAAEFGGLHSPVNFERSRFLLELARRYLPGLQSEGSTVWAGHRPATPDSLPVIGPSPRWPTVFYAFGHGHLGLTQAATTGRLIADLVLNRRASNDIDLRPYHVTRFGS